MNIGLFSDTYYPDINGVVTSITMLEKELEKLGHNVYIFTTSTHKALEGKNNVYMLNSIPFILCPSYRIATVVSPQIEEIILSLHLDIIHTQSEFSLGIFAKKIARKNNIKIIHTYHTMWEDYIHYIAPEFISKQKFAKRFVRKIYKLYSKNCAHLICPSEKTKTYLIEKCGITDLEINVIPNGIDLASFKKDNYSKDELANFKKSLGLSLTDKIILYVGRLAKEKSIDLIIKEFPKVVSQHPECKFVIVGDGPEKSNLIKLSNSLGVSDKIIFLGNQPLSKIGMFYNLGDIFVNASTSETQGLTYVEAMASGIPVIAKYDTNILELITSYKNGIIFKEDSEISHKIHELFTNKDLYNSITLEATKTSQDYSAEYFGKKVESLYLK